MTMYVNLFGGPGAGKSTTAASLFAEMKKLGKNVELVTEVAKDFVWEERQKTLEIQPYITVKQLPFKFAIIAMPSLVVRNLH